MKNKLPFKIAEQLLYAKEEDTERFLSLVVALKDAGWTFAAIAQPFGVTRSAANQWHKRALAEKVEPAPLPPSAKPVIPVTARGTKRKLRKDVPPKDRQHLSEVAALARKNTRWSREDSPERQAAYEFERLIRLHVLERDVPITTFAARAGVTRRAIMQRVEKSVN